MQPYILVADDDADDRFLLETAFQEERMGNRVVYFHDGVELVEHLNHTQMKPAPEGMFPGLILLDLNMPRKDGRQVLAEIKNDPRLKYIPILVFSTSEALRDIKDSYQLGANSYIIKPSDYTHLTSLVRIIRDFWLGFVTLPRHAITARPEDYN